MNFQDNHRIGSPVSSRSKNKRLWPRNQRAADTKSHSQKYYEYITHILLTDYLLQQRCTV